MSSSASDVVMTTTGIRRKDGSALISQGLAAVLSWHVEVEQDQSGPRRGGGLGVVAPAIEIVHQLLAVGHEAEIIGAAAHHPGLFE